MSIKAITKYKYKEKEYDTLLDIKEEIHNIIGIEVLDEITRNCPLEHHRDYLKLLELLCSPKIRKVLKESFSATYTIDGEDERTEKTINVLDLK